MPPKRPLLRTRRKQTNPSLKSSQGSRASFRSHRSITKKKYRLKTLLNERQELPTHKIPKHKLEAALKIIESYKKPFYESKENGCLTAPGVSSTHSFGSKRDSFRKLLSACRDCVVNRDWVNLSAVLAVAKPIIDDQYSKYTPYFYRYAAICLIYAGDEESLDKFLHGIIGCITEYDKQMFLKSLVSFLKDDENYKKGLKGYEKRLTVDLNNDGIVFSDSDSD